MPRPDAPPGGRPFTVLIAALLIAFLAWAIWRTSGERLVVYCAHDSIHAGAILAGFEEASGIELDVRFDTEATKSLGLIERIRREAETPQCDVFWNNELLGTMRLAREGLLEPYRGPGYERIPERARDPDGRWAGFAARLRLWIVNTDLMDADAGSIAAAAPQLCGLDRDADLGRVAIAKPLYGTTRTHLTALCERDGLERLAADFARWREAGLQIVDGNAIVKDLVANGHCALGWTDTDDYFLAVDAGAPVAAVPVELDGATICIPNTVGIVRGTPRRAQAEELVDYLLSAEVELRLATSRARQVPLGPVDEDALPDELRELREWATRSLDVRGLARVDEECLAWLKREFLR